MHDIILKAGTKNIEVVSCENPSLIVQGEELIKAIKSLLKLDEHVDKLGRIGFDTHILRLILDIDGLETEALKDEGNVDFLVEQIRNRTASFPGKETSVVSIRKEMDTEHQCFDIVIETKNKNVTDMLVIDTDFLNSPEFKLIYNLRKKVKSIGPPPYQIRKGNQENTVDDVFVLSQSVIDLAQKGINIQRYKGLGEMNPDQLWETTMNPDSRLLLQVKIEDAVEADEIFTVLMGDQVDPRRRFIQENALDVKNLDV